MLTPSAHTRVIPRSTIHLLLYALVLRYLEQRRANSARLLTGAGGANQSCSA